MGIDKTDIIKNMEERKEKEIEYYEKKAKEQIINGENQGDFEGFNPFLLESYNFLKNFCQDKYRGKKILDYGCGNGVHSQWLENIAANLVAIDLSQKSLDIARKRTEKTEFFLMDCENMDFSDNSFDVVFDGGTFSSLDLNKALPEIIRVLKPNGFLIGIETFGHNPLTNLKRAFNKLTGKRTDWAVSHIFKTKDLKLAKKYFGKIETYYFHLISWAIFPFLKLPGAEPILKLLEKIDHTLLFVFPFLKRYSFKIVFIFSFPKKYDKTSL